MKEIAETLIVKGADIYAKDNYYYNILKIIQLLDFKRKKGS